MSLSVTTDVFCDGEGCNQWVEGVSGRSRAHGREARQLAARAGWRRVTIENHPPRHRQVLDLCPACLEARRV